MSGKSRRRGRRISRSQRQRVDRAVAAPVTAPADEKPASTSKAAPVATSAPVAARAPAGRTVVQAAPPNVSAELKRIGMVGGLMIVLLVAAYFVLPLF